MKFKILLFSLFTLLILSVATDGFAGSGKGVPSEKFQWGPYEDLGLLFAECDGFDVLLDWRGEGFWTTHYNKDGSDRFEFFLGRDTYAYWYNSEDPEIGYFSRGGKTNRHWFGEPFNSNRAEVGLLFQLVIPGHGPIFKEAGRVIYDFDTGEVLFSAGPHDLGPYWDFDWQSLCEYFTP